MYVTPFKQLSGREKKSIPILLNFLIDASGSMDPIKGTLAKAINEDFLGAMSNVNKAERSVLRVHAEAFSYESRHLWNGFKALWELGESPVSESDLNGEGLGGETALYKYTKTAFGHLVQASNTLALQMNMRAKSKLIVLTDGANNLEPLGAQGISQVRAAFAFPQERVEVQKILAYFKTRGGVDKEAIKKSAAQCRFDELYVFDRHNTDTTALRKEIRRVLRLLSEKGKREEALRPEGFEVYTKEELTLLRW